VFPELELAFLGCLLAFLFSSNLLIFGLLEKLLVLVLDGLLAL
jgi:hypothetical protein